MESLLGALRQRQSRCDELRLAIAARESASRRTFDRNLNSAIIGRETFPLHCASVEESL